ncbi:MAG: hypothetical protein GY822_28170, partial [Deltaproteobacteria bacterium]|nr:hypothetical protein [Deltaproteobacteria bacterium]
MRFASLLFFLLVAAAGSDTGLTAQENSAELKQAKTFLDAHCVTCHGNTTSEGNQNFETFSDKEWHDRELLNELLTVLKKKEMPPEDADNQPSQNEATDFEKLLITQYRTIKSKYAGVL